ncbi:MAG: hypothetical protein HY698_11850 [Deltaproteobacteria bacterium]|nr:hypothetical protein [Deltaproteobacteria bacterium]
METIRLVARSAARDLLRLVRALKARGLGLDALDVHEREALQECNRELATVLSVREGDNLDWASLEHAVAASRARLVSTRSAILERMGKRRAEILEAMLAVQVAEEDLQVEPPHEKEELDRVRARAARRLAYLDRSEAMRRRVEARAVDIEGSAEELVAGLPARWLRSIAKAVGRPRLRDPRAVARWIATPSVLAHLSSGLRPAEKRALARILAEGGRAHARALEEEFGDSTEDGFYWDREPPTSVLGRLRARGLCVIGRASLDGRRRSRPRVVVVPRDLREVLLRELAGVADEVPTVTVPDDVVEDVMTQDEDDPESAEAQAMLFDRAQPELASFAAGASLSLSSPGGTGSAALVYYVERLWAMYEAAHPERVPRLRHRDIEAARRASEQEFAVIEGMNERLLARRVGTLISSQPHLYAFLASVLEEEDLPLSEADKAVVFHACDTAIRAFDRALLSC